MKFQFHQTTFDLLQYEPSVSQKAVGKIATLESGLGIRLPESIREWYSLTEAVELLNLQDELVHFEPLGIDQNKKHLLKTKRLSKGGKYYWQVGDYSSGVYFSAEISTDPNPVVECHDTDGSRIDYADEWNERTFSEFTFACCWHRRLQSATHSHSGVVSSFPPSTIGVLHEFFKEGPRVMRGDAPAQRPNAFTGKGILPVIRFQLFFFNATGMLHLKSLDDPTSSATEVKWSIYSSTESSLSDIVSQLSDRGIISPVG